MGDPKEGDDVRGEEEREARRKLKGKEKIDDGEGTTEARRITIGRVDENIEEQGLGRGNGVGFSFMPCYLSASTSSSGSEVVDHSNGEDKIVMKRREIGGNSNRNKLAVASGGLDPEPCHHGWVGALGNMRGATAPNWVCSKNLTPTDLGFSLMPCYLSASTSSSVSEVVNHSNGDDKIVMKRRKIGGNSNRNKLAVASGGLDPEPCHHGWVGALGNMRGATAPTWVCCKNLTRTDLDPSQSRLLLPRADMEKFVGDFLTERERSELSRCGGGSGGVAAVMVDEMGRCWETRLNLWASKSYNLNGSGWRRIASRYELSEEYALKVGAFRYYAPAASTSHQSDDGHGYVHGEEEKSLGFVLLVQRKICKKES